MIDFPSIVPSITGKIELVYEGEQEGADEVARMLIDNAIISEFERIFPRIPRLEKEGVKTTYTDIIEWFNSNLLELNYTDDDTEFMLNLKNVKPLVTLVDEYCENMSEEDKTFCMELVLWSLTVSDKLDKAENEDTFKFDSADLDAPFFGSN